MHIRERHGTAGMTAICRFRWQRAIFFRLTRRSSIDGLVGYPSGQRGQTVNLLAYAFDGSNPSPTTIFFFPHRESIPSNADRSAHGSRNSAWVKIAINESAPSGSNSRSKGKKPQPWIFVGLISPLYSLVRSPVFTCERRWW